MHRTIPSFCFLSLLAAIAFSVTINAQPTISPEETAVRNAYARLAFATETNTLFKFSYGPKTATTIDAALAQDQLHVVLSSFKVGSVTDFAGHFTFADLADSPQTPLTVAAYKSQWQDKAGLVDEMAATAKWASTANPNAGFLLPLTTYANYGDSSVKVFNRYAMYVATVTLDGETRSARSTVLFDLQGRIAIVDELIGAPLIPFFTESVYPHILLETTARQKPEVEAWLPSHVVAASLCKADQQHDCFDAAAGFVGIHPDDLKRSLISPPVRKPVLSTPAALFHAPNPQFPPTMRTDDYSPQCSDYNIVAPIVTLSSGDTT